jgi:hypothetical protein
MDDIVRRRALNYAAKTVMSAAFLAACGGTSESEPATDDGQQASESEIISGQPSCREALATLKEVFPEGDQAWWQGKTSPELKGNAEVASCCQSMLKSTDDPMKSFRYQTKFRNAGCCSADYTAVKETNDAEPFNMGSACTPWGPPVPPSMDWGVA